MEQAFNAISLQNMGKSIRCYSHLTQKQQKENIT